MTMYPTTYLAMYGILFYSVYLCGKYPLRTAIVGIVVAGWILLPQAHLAIPHIPFKTKVQAISIAVLLGIIVKDPKRLTTLRLSWMDLPMACWCIAPFLSSVMNDLGAYDGLNGLEFQVVDFAIPYLAGRLYFGSYDGLRELAIGQILGGVVLVPLVVFELVMSPQLHTWVYGWYPHDWIQTMRDGGYRPSVFMSHGLELAIWNAAAAFMGWQLFLHKGIPKSLPLLNIPTVPSLVALTLLLVASHSSGALVLFVVAMVLFQATVRFKTKMPLILLLLIPLLYMNLRGTGAWDGQSLLDISKAITRSEGRVSSLRFRLTNENLLVEKALIRPIFGWGAYQRSFVTDESGNYISVPDGKWIVIIGENGLFGLTSFGAFMLLPALVFFLKCPTRELGNPLVISSAAFATFLCITMIDNLFNAMNNPLLIVVCGGLSSLVLSPGSMSLTTQANSEHSALRAQPAIFPPTRTI